MSNPLSQFFTPFRISGIGSEADSLNSVYRLVPKVPKKDVSFDEWLLNQGQVMRFTGKLVDGPGKPPVPENEKVRTFVVSFFLEDNSLAVFEPPVMNSGYPGGKYLERRPSRKSAGRSSHCFPIARRTSVIGLRWSVHAGQCPRTCETVSARSSCWHWVWQGQVVVGGLPSGRSFILSSLIAT